VLISDQDLAIPKPRAELFVASDGGVGEHNIVFLLVLHRKQECLVIGDADVRAQPGLTGVASNHLVVARGDEGEGFCYSITSPVEVGRLKAML
jgi:hypothetical protein